MARVAAKALTKISRDDCFLIDKHASTHRKIKFLDCVYDIPTGNARPRFDPEEKLLEHVQRSILARVQADVDAALTLVEDIFTLPEVDTTPRNADANFGIRKNPTLAIRCHGHRRCHRRGRGR